LGEYYPGIDVGTTVIKALLMDKEGKVLSIVSRGYEKVKKEKVEQNPLEWWEKIDRQYKEVFNVHQYDTNWS